MELQKIQAKESTLQLMSFIAKKDNLELTILEKNMSVSSAFDGTQIHQLSKKMEERDLVKAISFLILRTCELFNIKGNVSESQSVIIALDLIDKYKYETFEDFVLMFKYARQGYFGDVFRIDGNVIMGNWMPKYLEMKSQERENRIGSKKSNDQLKTEEISSDYRTFFQKYLQDRKQKRQSMKSLYKNYEDFINHLPKDCMSIPDDILDSQIKLAMSRKLPEALEIYKNEKKRRENEK